MHTTISMSQEQSRKFKKQNQNPKKKHNAVEKGRKQTLQGSGGSDSNGSGIDSAHNSHL